MTNYTLTTGAASASARTRSALALGWLAAAVLAAGCQDASAPEESPTALGAQKADVADAAVPATGVGTASTVSNFQGWDQIPGGTFNAAPAVTSRGAGSIDLYARGLDSALYYNYWSDPAVLGGTGYIGWSSMGGALTSKPSATSWSGRSSSGSLAVVAKGLDNAIWNNVSVGPGHPKSLGWLRIPGGTFSTAPAIAFDGTSLYVFARKSDKKFYWTSNNVRNGFSNTGWTAWQAIPVGLFISEPAAAAVLGSTIQVVGEGLDSAFYRSKLIGSTWSSWSEVPGGGTFKSAPAISSPAGSCHVDVFGRGLDNFVWVNTSEDCGDSWTGFDRIPGGTVTTAPAAWASSSRRVDLVARGGDNAIWRNTAK